MQHKSIFFSTSTLQNLEQGGVTPLATPQEMQWICYQGSQGYLPNKLPTFIQFKGENPQVALHFMGMSCHKDSGEASTATVS